MTRAWSLLLIAAVTPLPAADWLSADGDPDRTRWQKDETELSPATVGEVKLLWKREFEHRLSAPVALGPIYTHRGVKELVFVADASSHIYAVDADLNRVFWQRKLETTTASPLCSGDPPPAPAIEPATARARKSDDPSSPKRPIYMLTRDGMLHMLRPTDGVDIRSPLAFLPPTSSISNLNVSDGSVEASTNFVCGDETKSSLHPASAWTLDVNIPGAKPGGGSHFDLTFGRSATWKDPSGLEWTYVPNPTGIRAFHQTNDAVWNSAGLPNPASPVIANGMVFTLSEGALIALDATTGKQLYSSGNATQVSTATDSLAIANGHIFFVSGSTLFCFGFPIEI